jgi:Fe-S oxidoreductase
MEPLTVEAANPVLLFPDTFVNFYEPEIGFDVWNLLHRLNCNVSVGFPEHFKASRLPENGLVTGLRCCGRPMVSNGLLSQAVRNAEYNVERLYPWAKTSKPIIACEPSCILTIRDDYPALLRGELRQKAEKVASLCLTFEEYVESILSQPSKNEPSQVQSHRALKKGPKKILLQGHCHQRALVGMEPAWRLLRRIPEAEVIDLDAGCCGMAGSFGYEKEHYEISRLVGEQRLFPALRQADAGTVIVAPGFSCRMQIDHFTGRKALHPAQLLFSLLENPSCHAH